MIAQICVNKMKKKETKNKLPFKVAVFSFRLKFGNERSIANGFINFIKKDKKGTLIERIDTFTWSEGFIFKKKYFGIFMLYRRKGEKKK